MHLGTFDNEEDAARAFDAAARRLRGGKAHGGRVRGKGLRLNFPTEKEKAAASAAEDSTEEMAQASEELVAKRRAAGEPSSRFPGVHWAKQRRRWAARANVGGDQRILGHFVKEEEAGEAAKAAGAVERKTSSRYRGVSWYNHRRKWVAQIHINGNKKSLGLFKKEEEAARAYNKEAERLLGESARLNPLPARD